MRLEPTLPDTVGLVGCRRLEEPSQLLAAGELVASLAVGQSRPYMLACRWPLESIVLGLYSSAPTTIDERLVYRRITGGNPVRLRGGETYLVLALPGFKILQGLVGLGEKLAKCINIRAYGATVLDETGYLEAFAAEDVVAEDLGNCLGFRLRRGPTVTPLEVAEAARLFEARSWRLYRYRRLRWEALEAAKPHYLRASVETVDGYIVDWSLDGNIYMAPPMEIYSILASLKGTPFNQIVFGNLEAAVEARIQVHGLEKTNLIRLFRRLYEAAGVDA